MTCACGKPATKLDAAKSPVCARCARLEARGYDQMKASRAEWLDVPADDPTLAEIHAALDAYWLRRGLDEPVGLNDEDFPLHLVRKRAKRAIRWTLPPVQVPVNRWLGWVPTKLLMNGAGV